MVKKVVPKSDATKEAPPTAEESQAVEEVVPKEAPKKTARPHATKNTQIAIGDCGGKGVWPGQYSFRDGSQPKKFTDDAAELLSWVAAAIGHDPGE